MPYIKNEIGKKLSDDDKNTIKVGLGNIMKNEAKKPEKVLMINMVDNQDMYLGGKKGEYAYIEVKLLGKLTLDQKENISSKMTKLYDDILGISGDKIYITFATLEREDWAYKGKTLYQKS